MRRRASQLSTRHRWWFYSVSLLLFLSGACWVLFRWLEAGGMVAEDSLGTAKSWSLKLHGAAAMASLVALGILIPTHIRRGWQARRNRANGVFFIAAIALLLLTGYGLYYLGNEQWRSAASWIHIILGLAAPVLLGLHIWQGRRAARRA